MFTFFVAAANHSATLCHVTKLQSTILITGVAVFAKAVSMLYAKINLGAIITILQASDPSTRSSTNDCVCAALPLAFSLPLTLLYRDYFIMIVPSRLCQSQLIFTVKPTFSMDTMAIGADHSSRPKSQPLSHKSNRIKNLMKPLGPGFLVLVS